VHITIEITVPPTYTDTLTEELEQLEHMIAVSVLRGASIKPPGDVVTVHVLNRGADQVMSLADAARKGGQVSVSTSELSSIQTSVSPRVSSSKSLGCGSAWGILNGLCRILENSLYESLVNLHYTRVSCFALMCTWKVLVKEEAYGCRQVPVPAGRDDSTWLVGALHLRGIPSTNSSLLDLSDLAQLAFSGRYSELATDHLCPIALRVDPGRK
jgi:hypothetical protein